MWRPVRTSKGFDVEIPELDRAPPRCDRANNSHVESPERAVPVTGHAAQARSDSMRSVVSTSECLAAYMILYYSSRTNFALAISRIYRTYAWGCLQEFVRNCHCDNHRGARALPLIQ